MAATLLRDLVTLIKSPVRTQFGYVWGVEQDMEKLLSTLSTILGVLDDAEAKEFTDKSTADWLRKLKDAAADAQDVFEKWSIAEKEEQEMGFTNIYCIKQVCAFIFRWLNPKYYLFRRSIGVQINEIMTRFDQIAAERFKFHLIPGGVEAESQFGANRKTTSIPKEPQIYGRDGDKDDIVNLLLSCGENENVCVCPIVGIGGLGKTTLAQLVYNDETVRSFFDVRIWVCVSDPFDVKKVLKAIIEYSDGAVCNLENLQTIQDKVGDILRRKRYLLVLDDVWNDNRDEWNNLKSSLMGGAKGSSIIVTTRLDIVASITGTMPKYSLKPLSDDDCWILFKSCAFGDRGEENSVLVGIGKQIVEKCQGVPLAAKSLGSLLSFKLIESYWKLVRDSEMWNLEENAENEILPASKLCKTLGFYIDNL